jgi:hypothetical protein
MRSCVNALKLNARVPEGYPPDPREIVERDDGLWSIGWHDDASGPFETRGFAEAVAGMEARNVASSSA